MARRKEEPAYSGDIESEIDAYLVFESCKAGLTPFAPREPSSGEIDVRSGDVYVLRDLGPTPDSIVREWDDGICWEPIHEDDMHFQHFKNSTQETLGRKVWATNDRHRKFGLVIYYTLGETFGKRPFQDADFFTYIYKVGSLIS